MRNLVSIAFNDWCLQKGHEYLNKPAAKVCLSLYDLLVNIKCCRFNQFFTFFHYNFIKNTSMCKSKLEGKFVNIC